MISERAGNYPRNNEMTSLEHKAFYRRGLPHFQPEDAILFVTFRLKDSIPQYILEKLKSERDNALKILNSQLNGKELNEQLDLLDKKEFGKFDAFLDRCESQNQWLKDPLIAKMVQEAIHFRDGKSYELHAYCIMPNHIHMVFKPIRDSKGKIIALQKILHSLKRYTASEANIILGRQGKPFWQAESYDRVVRDQAEWERIIAYVMNNPVKAGLVENAEDWPWSYYKS